ncbi:MAG: DUF434 domain-containing protein [Thermoguttaceae bacterium]
MPDRRTHRGPHPEDARLFAAEIHARLSQAVDDLSWLLTRGYAHDSSLKLVGDRYGLVARQRIAVARCSCSDGDGDRRRIHEVTAQSLSNRSLKLDGYNVLTTIEAALSGGVILAARDGAFRDMASMHGTYRKVAETLPAFELLGAQLADLNLAECIWYLDRPVSNSGRLKSLMEELARKKGWPWQVELEQNPDALLAESPEVVATADSVILDRCRWWYNLARIVVTRHVRQAWIVDLSR